MAGFPQPPDKTIVRGGNVLTGQGRFAAQRADILLTLCVGNKGKWSLCREHGVPLTKRKKLLLVLSKQVCIARNRTSASYTGSRCPVTFLSSPAPEQVSPKAIRARPARYLQGQRGRGAWLPGRALALSRRKGLPG